MNEGMERHEALSTVKAAAAVASCHEDTIRRAYTTGSLAVIRLGRRLIRIEASALRQWWLAGGPATEDCGSVGDAREDSQASHENAIAHSINKDGQDREFSDGGIPAMVPYNPPSLCSMRRGEAPAEPSRTGERDSRLDVPGLPDVPVCRTLLAWRAGRRPQRRTRPDERYRPDPARARAVPADRSDEPT